MLRVERLLDEVEHEVLTPRGMGIRLFNAFRAHPGTSLPVAPVAFLLAEYRVYSASSSGYPTFHVKSPLGREPVGPWFENTYLWKEEPARTDNCQPDHPFIRPDSVAHAPFIVTVTHATHFFYTPHDTDILIARMGPGDIRPYWYKKPRNGREHPVSPQPLVDLRQVGGLVHFEPRNDPAALIQEWKLDGDAYALQAGLELRNLSLKNFLRIMAVQPSRFPQIASK